MSNRFDIVPLDLAGLHLLRRHPFSDARGMLDRLFCAGELAPVLGDRTIVQINHSRTRMRGAVRGMHFQQGSHAECKLVMCLRGEVFDVAVDTRSGSSTRWKWHAERLRAEDGKIMVIPEGFAHGFQTLVDDCELLYFHTAPWCTAAETGLHPQDPTLGIRWPLPVVGLSTKDASRPLIIEEKNS